LDELERRKHIREGLLAHHNRCHKCGAAHVRVDGKDIGGMPGIQYKHCRACGWSQAVTKRQRREKLGG
jgi:hypothetical protein